MLALPEERYRTAQQVTEFYRPLLARLEALPGVVDAAASRAIPPYEAPKARSRSRASRRRREQALLQQVSEAYFRVLGIELARGRAFSEADVSDARRVAVVNEGFARKYLPGGDPLGQRLRIAALEKSRIRCTTRGSRSSAWSRDVTNRGLQVEIQPEVWIPHTIARSAGWRS